MSSENVPLCSPRPETVKVTVFPEIVYVKSDFSLSEIVFPSEEIVKSKSPSSVFNVSLEPESE